MTARRQDDRAERALAADAMWRKIQYANGKIRLAKTLIEDGAYQAASVELRIAAEAFQEVAVMKNKGLEKVMRGQRKNKTI